MLSLSRQSTSLIDYDHLISEQKNNDNGSFCNSNSQNEIRNSGSMTTTIRKSLRTLTWRKTPNTTIIPSTITTSHQRFDSTNSNSKLFQRRRHSSSSYEQQLFEPRLNDDDMTINENDQEEVFSLPSKPFDRIAHRIRKSFRSMGRQTKNVLRNQQRGGDGGGRSRLESNNSNKRLIIKAQSFSDLYDQTTTTTDENSENINGRENNNHQEIKVAISSTMPLIASNKNNEQNQKSQQRRRAPQAPVPHFSISTMTTANDRKPTSVPDQLSKTKSRACDESGYSSLSEPTNSERSSVNSVNKQKNKTSNRTLRTSVSFFLKKRQSSLSNENLPQQQQISSNGKKQLNINRNNRTLLTLSPAIDEEDNNTIHYNDDENIVAEYIDQTAKKPKLTIGKRFQTLRRSFVSNKRCIVE